MKETLHQEKDYEGKKERNLFLESDHPVDTGRKLNVHKTFRRRPGRLLNVSCTFNLRPVSTGQSLFRIFLAKLDLRSILKGRDGTESIIVGKRILVYFAGLLIKEINARDSENFCYRLELTVIFQVNMIM